MTTVAGVTSGIVTHRYAYISLRPNFHLLGIAVHLPTSALLEKSRIANHRNRYCRRSLIWPNRQSVNTLTTSRSREGARRIAFYLIHHPLSRFQLYSDSIRLWHSCCFPEGRDPGEQAANRVAQGIRSRADLAIVSRTKAKRSSENEKWH